MVVTQKVSGVIRGVSLRSLGVMSIVDAAYLVGFSS